MLERVFDARAVSLLNTENDGVSQYKDEYGIWRISRTCVYFGPLGQANASIPTGKLVPYKTHKPLTMSDPNRVKPEIMLGSEFVPVKLEDVKDTYLLPVAASPVSSVEEGVWVLRRVDGNTYEYDHTIPKSLGLNLTKMNLRPFSIPQGILSSCETELKGGFAAAQPGLMKSAMGGFAVLMLTYETEMLYTTTDACDAADTLTVIMPDGTTLEGDGLTQKGIFKRLLKRSKKKMKGLGNPVEKKPTKAELAAEKPAEAPVEPVAAPATAAPVVPPPPAPKIEPAPEPAPVPEPTPAPQPQATAPAQEADEPAIDATEVKRKRAPKGPAGGLLNDYTKTMELLSTPLPSVTAGDNERAIEEIRQLRDMSILVSRRIANIAIDCIKAGSTSAEKLSAIIAAING